MLKEVARERRWTSSSFEGVGLETVHGMGDDSDE